MVIRVALTGSSKSTLNTIQTDWEGGQHTIFLFCDVVWTALSNLLVVFWPFENHDNLNEWTSWWWRWKGLKRMEKKSRGCSKRASADNITINTSTSKFKTKVHSPNILHRGTVRIGSIIICHLSKLWKAKFSILCGVICLVRGNLTLITLGSEQANHQLQYNPHPHFFLSPSSHQGHQIIIYYLFHLSPPAPPSSYTLFQFWQFNNWSKCRPDQN